MLTWLDRVPSSPLLSTVLLPTLGRQLAGSGRGPSIGSRNSHLHLARRNGRHGPCGLVPSLGTWSFEFRNGEFMHVMMRHDLVRLDACAELESWKLPCLSQTIARWCEGARVLDSSIGLHP
ncbi:hypothetical protein K466DRAFT_317382 [Polyporus arcularius HHB13444]|uniref:Uncharacterized protein n=1 Tax=Polyporus arcularius HHB13444 TaxID=1314778 RepID=A0A5C3NXL4_9APHY|nr:hypothetical protein K466DRAFT_317382 [Polyporus arcularius HHB13444]